MSKRTRVDKINTSNDMYWQLDCSSFSSQYPPYYNHDNQYNAQAAAQHSHPSFQTQSPTQSFVSPTDLHNSPLWYHPTSPQSPPTSSASSASLYTPANSDSSAFPFPPPKYGIAQGSKQPFTGMANMNDLSSPLSPISGTTLYPNYDNEMSIADQSIPSLRNVAHAGNSIKTQVATDALVKASRSRRKDPTSKGRYVCQLCNQDFTASHNLNSMSNT
ncbi:hypothetical protein VKT23_009096 [Stygiomarasmius scandens]|uniref:C2H2-type domain-containing protein n=1 Tax=Marasmiellus scandens TaxID=2682957 RepID=A0ABR1JH48_9AGAR